MNPYNVLFLCTGNSARSILAESIMTHLGKGQFVGLSAGSHPKGEVHPLAISLLRQLDFPIEGLRSKSWDEFAEAGRPPLDFIITVCDNAAGEACPYCPGQPITAHWGVPDPATVQGTDLERMNAFREAFRTLSRRIAMFLALPISALDRMALTDEIGEIGTR